MNHFLIHDSQDNVGVAVVDIRAGITAKGATLDGKSQIQLKALQDIPLGHKIALQDFDSGDTVLKYGEDIGKVVSRIKKAHMCMFTT